MSESVQNGQVSDLRNLPDFQEVHDLGGSKSGGLFQRLVDGLLRKLATSPRRRPEEGEPSYYPVQLLDGRVKALRVGLDLDLRESLLEEITGMVFREPRGTYLDTD